MFQKILLCTDGSEQALTAARVAADLASRLDTHVNVVHVLDPMLAVGYSTYCVEAGLAEPILLQYAEEGQREILKRTREVIDSAHISSRSFAEFGQPVERIHHIAEQEKSDLIVIGSRGLTSWSSLLLGSVSEGVARHAPCPVLVVRGHPDGFHQILVATDGSIEAGHALRAGKELARDYQATISILNVFQPHSDFPDVSRDDSDPDSYAIRVQEALTLQIKPIMSDAGIPYRIYQEQGHPVETIAGFAETQKTDLIVVGSRGLGGFQRLLMGSVSTGVLHHAHCSVLVVR